MNDPNEELKQILRDNDIQESKEASILKPLFDAFGVIFSNYSKRNNDDK